MHKFMFSRKNLGIPYGLFLAVFVMAPLLVLIYFREKLIHIGIIKSRTITDFALSLLVARI